MSTPAGPLACLPRLLGGPLSLVLACGGGGDERDAPASTAPAPAAAAPAPSAAAPLPSLAPLVERVAPAVVTIRAHGKPVGPPTWFGLGPAPEARGTGSGFVYDAEGIVVTNHHVIEGARRVEVLLPDGRRFDAVVRGTDAPTDLAVLAIEGEAGLTAVTVGTSKDLRVGDWVVAVGNPMGLERSASAGIVGGKGRGSLGLYADSYLDFLQTDADLGPGSSGGPLFDLAGRVVGITTAVGRGGPGFAIPIDQARAVIEVLREEGEVRRGWLGIAGEERQAEQDETAGARIGRVYAGTPAADAGLRAGDRVLAIDGRAVESFADLRAHVASLPPGHTARLEVERDGARRTLEVLLEERPDAPELERLDVERDGRWSWARPPSR